MSKYCVAKPEPKWEKVLYKGMSNTQLEVRRSSYRENTILLSTKDSNGEFDCVIDMQHMQDLIDSLQAFYDQEKGEG